MKEKTPRILGYDFARGLAIVGMIFVNFKTVMVSETDAFLFQLVELLSGKAAALFVVLAGVGMTLMYQSAQRKNDVSKIRKVKTNLLKRAAFLLVIGLSYYPIWPADILHYYGLFISLGILFLSLSQRWLQAISLFLVIGYTFLMIFYDYETGWDWASLEYTDFYTLNGFYRNLFLNGFHPVIPWFAFLLTGIWVGRINFTNAAIRKRVAVISLSIFIAFKGLSMILVSVLSKLSQSEAIDFEYTLGTSPMPPLFFYMVTASSLAVFIISISIYITYRFQNYLVIKQIINTGQLALSNYFFHVIIGMLAIEVYFGKLERAFSIEFTFVYASMYCVLIIILSQLWRKRFRQGPLEYLMRKITG